ncbi:hypothetical protein DJICPGNB_08170 [Escherichia coli]|nr:hypothetical protein DJICPGNB_08170 [Escherichia coli]
MAFDMHFLREDNAAHSSSLPALVYFVFWVSSERVMLFSFLRSDSTITRFAAFIQFLTVLLGILNRAATR